MDERIDEIIKYLQNVGKLQVELSELERLAKEKDLTEDSFEVLREGLLELKFEIILEPKNNEEDIKLFQNYSNRSNMSNVGMFMNDISNQTRSSNFNRNDIDEKVQIRKVQEGEKARNQLSNEYGYSSTDINLMLDQIESGKSNAKNLKEEVGDEAFQLLSTMLEADESQELLFMKNALLIVHIASDFHSRNNKLPLDDLIQIGWEAMKNSILNFNFEKETKLSTYAYDSIYRTMLRRSQDQGRVISLPVYYQ
ncbi:MAG: hypothetical protein LBM99_02360, partial [Bacillales bacterium]|nr:hypothetical protein [Bacillales bacterium]